MRFFFTFLWVLINFLPIKIFFPKYPSIFLRYILYIRKIKLPIYPWLPIFSSLAVRARQSVSHIVVWIQKRRRFILLRQYDLRCESNQPPNRTMSFETDKKSFKMHWKLQIKPTFWPFSFLSKNWMT